MLARTHALSYCCAQSTVADELDSMRPISGQMEHVSLGGSVEEEFSAQGSRAFELQRQAAPQGLPEPDASV